MNRQSIAWEKVVILLMLPVLAAFIFAADSYAAATPASSVWSKTLTNSSDSSYSVYEVLPLAKTSGYLTVGGVYSTEDSGAWVMKIDANGAIESSYTYSGVSIDMVQEVTGGVIAIGYTYNDNQGDCTPGVDCPDDFIDCEPGVDCPGDEYALKQRKSYGLGSTIIMKLDQYGSILWQKELSSDSGSSIEINGVKESGVDRYKLSGVMYTTESNAKLLVIEVDGTEDSFNPTLTSTVKSVVVADGADISVFASEVKPTKDNGYLATGVVSDSSGTTDATFIAAIKIKADGSIEWAKKYSLEDGSSLEFNDVTPVKDGYIATGQTISADGAEYTNWLAKLSTTGAITWVKTVEMADEDATATVYSHGVREDSDGGYITAAMVYDDEAGTSETVIVKLDSTGAIKWQNKLGSDSEQYYAEDIRPLRSGYFVGGIVSSTEDQTSSPWFAKLDNKGTTRCTTLTSTTLLKTVPQGLPSQENIAAYVSLEDDAETIIDADAALEGVEVDSSVISDDGSCTQMSITVEMNLVNNAAGSVKSVPAGINCKSTTGTSCDSDPLFWPGSEVTLTATATKGSMFDGWYDSEGTQVTVANEQKPNVYVMTVATDGASNIITAKFSKPVKITGYAKDVNGKGISGATVTIAKDTGDVDENGDPVYVAMTPGKTNSKGLFTLQASPDATYLITVSKTGYTFSPSEQTVNVTDSDTEVDSDFIGHVYTLTGSVTKYNANGEEVAAAKARVKLMLDTGDVDDNGDPIYQTKTATTNAKGIYTFKKIAAGDYIIEVTSGSSYYGEGFVSVDDFEGADEKDVVEATSILMEETEL